MHSYARIFEMAWSAPSPSAPTPLLLHPPLRPLSHQRRSIPNDGVHCVQLVHFLNGFI